MNQSVALDRPPRPQYIDGQSGLPNEPEKFSGRPPQGRQRRSREGRSGRGGNLGANMIPNTVQPKRKAYGQGAQVSNSNQHGFYGV